MANEVTMKVSVDGREFIKKLIINRIKVSDDNDVMNYTQAFDMVVKYFKDNNDRYKELAAMEVKNV